MSFDKLPSQYFQVIKMHTLHLYHRNRLFSFFYTTVLSTLFLSACINDAQSSEEKCRISHTCDQEYCRPLSISAIYFDVEFTSQYMSIDHNQIYIVGKLFDHKRAIPTTFKSDIPVTLAVAPRPTFGRSGTDYFLFRVVGRGREAPATQFETIAESYEIMTCPD